MAFTPGIVNRGGSAGVLVCDSAKRGCRSFVRNPVPAGWRSTRRTSSRVYHLASEEKDNLNAAILLEALGEYLLARYPSPYEPVWKSRRSRKSRPLNLLERASGTSLTLFGGVSLTCGNVLTQGCVEWYLTFQTLTPASSHISRCTASSNVSPGSINPARAE
jgi:hypothetical protein